MGEYIREFETVSAYTTSRENDYIEPWVSLTDSTGDLNYNKSEYEKLLSMPLTTIAKENGTISFNIWKSMSTDMITSVSYSTDNGETWTTTNNTNNKSEHLVIAVNVNEGDRIMWKANAQQNGYFDEDDYDDYVGSFFSSTCEFDVEGNVMSMINDAIGLTYNGQLCHLFSDYDDNECLVADASKLILPATTLASGCYSYMFANCTSLTQAPALSATTLAEYCYVGMFSNCTSLITAPALPATTLTDFCYEEMFMNCTSLTQAPELPATILAEYCYGYMFYGCTGLTQAPELPATTLANYCYYNMFIDCRSLTKAPELPATTLTNSCYSYMFNGCTSLNYIKCLATNTSASNCTYLWVYNVASSGTFIGDPNSTWTINNSGIPSGWNYNNVNINIMPT